MMEDRFYVATIEIQISGIILDGAWEKFKTNSEDSIDLFSVSKLTPFLECYHIENFELSRDISYMYKYGTSIMFVDRKWNNILILCDNTDAIDTFLIQTFYTHAVQRKMIQIHSSMVNYLGKGILFLGPSGIGKTTMAELWNKYRDVLIINGDMNFVQEIEDAFLGWGTPWHGSSPYCENTNVPVKAMIVLKQASKNTIRELTGFEKVTAVSNNVFYPRWLENGMELCLETLDHLLTKIPVYELSCRPDEDAVRLTEEVVFGKDTV